MYYIFLPPWLYSLITSNLLVAKYKHHPNQQIGLWEVFRGKGFMQWSVDAKNIIYIKHVSIIRILVDVTYPIIFPLNPSNKHIWEHTNDNYLCKLIVHSIIVVDIKVRFTLHPPLSMKTNFVSWSPTLISLIIMVALFSLCMYLILVYYE